MALKGIQANEEVATTAKRIDKGTRQQDAYWGDLVNGRTNILSEARAGSGKSSSSREGMWRMLEQNSRLRILYTVYNKSNADEFAAQCPPLVSVMTSHKVGYAAVRAAFRNAALEKNKTYVILDKYADTAKMPRWLRKAIAMAVGLAKNYAIMPDNPDEAFDSIKDLIVHHDVTTYGKDDVVAEAAVRVLYDAAEWTDIVDFDDMIWLPVVHQLPFEKYDVVFLDEVQDWNACQHAMIPLLTQGSGRVVGVGDSLQAINAFRGADQDSMDNLGAMLSSTERGVTSAPLTITFRCPSSHVDLARHYAPDMQARDNAPEGVIANTTYDGMLKVAAPGDLVICPTNAPVVKGCLKKMAQKIPAVVRGRSLGDQLNPILWSIKDAATISDLSYGVEKWRNGQLNRLARLEGVEDVIDTVNDRADSLQAIVEACSQVPEVSALVDSLATESKRSDVVTFSTIHRSKGDEAENVFLIEAPTRKPTRAWQERQNRNLRYVGLTRAKKSLTFVEPEKTQGQPDGGPVYSRLDGRKLRR